MDARKILATHIPKEGIEDNIDWKFTSSCNYSAKTGYWYLNKGTPIDQLEKQFWKSIWNSDIFLEWKHFLWKIAVKAIPTASNLTKRQIKMDEKCKFCKLELEDETHLFKNCEFTQRIWTSTMGIKISNVTDTPVKDWIRNFLNLFRKKKQEEFVELRRNFIATLWSIWLHRNEIVFKGGSPNPMSIMEIYRDSKEKHIQATKQWDFAKSRVHKTTM
ncbi:uncharacterized protein LOC125493613 [Beta vulgaris subsp. vulgaris]|uniref:uncharacterized protein LOC125493613 n=1 Tax=Beta vulgaris subsp. vulgaris TaxID=3555 RepID=UPI00203713CB|nr:uncharacterized protein LOC125493613 [Beta vulgaris subsp. vulgaris]